MNKKSTRLIVDIGMVILLPLLMAYSLIGEMFHEITGTAMTVLFVIHLIQNRKWLAAIPKGKYSSRRVFQTILDLMLLIFMIMQPVSGILMSKHLYTFIKVSGISSLMRQIHMVLAYWGFVLMSVHAGTHLQLLFKKLWTRTSLAKKGGMLMIGVTCLNGVYAFFKRQIPSYLFLKTSFVFFDFSESRIFFIVDYLSIMLLFAVVGSLITAWLTLVDN